jgi:aminopeptidase N
MATTWPDVERALAGLPRPAVAGVAARAARGAVPAVAALEAVYGPEAREWAAACVAALVAVEAVADDLPVSRFKLLLAAETARCAAAATADAARRVGPSPLVEAAEFAYAAVAFAADACRAESPARAASLAMQACRAAAGGGPVPPGLLASG